MSLSRLFHHVIILSLKKCCLRTVLNLTVLLRAMYSCPRVRDDMSKVKNNPCVIYISNKYYTFLLASLPLICQSQYDYMTSFSNLESNITS